MLNFSIKHNETTYKCDRFSKESHINVVGILKAISSADTITFVSSSYTSWEDAYTIYIAKRLQTIYTKVKDKIQEKQVTAVNNISGDIYFLAGRGIAIEQSITSIEQDTEEVEENTSSINQDIEQDVEKVKQSAAFIGICNTMYNTEVDKLFAANLNLQAIKRAIQYIIRYQLCLYHWLNIPIHRSLTTTKTYNNSECNYGSYIRYLSIKARWNYYVFMSWFNCNIVGGGDAISIAVGVNNIFNNSATADMHITIEPQDTSRYMIWHGIFLEESSTLDTNITSNRGRTGMAIITGHKIYRRGGFCYKLKNDYYEKRWTGIEAKEIQEDIDSIADIDVDSLAEEDIRKVRGEAFAERVFYPTPSRANTSTSPTSDHNNPIDTSAYVEVTTPEDITNPNNCVWSAYGGWWSTGYIQLPSITLKEGQSFKQVYSISRHPAVSGRTTRDRIILFNIIVNFRFCGYSITRTYYDVACYMQCPLPTESTKDKSSEVRYILTATENMGKYLDPMPSQE